MPHSYNIQKRNRWIVCHFHCIIKKKKSIPLEVGHMGFHWHPFWWCPQVSCQAEQTKPTYNDGNKHIKNRQRHKLGSTFHHYNKENNHLNAKFTDKTEKKKRIHHFKCYLKWQDWLIRRQPPKMLTDERITLQPRRTRNRRRSHATNRTQIETGTNTAQALMLLDHAKGGGSSIGCSQRAHQLSATATATDTAKIE